MLFMVFIVCDLEIYGAMLNIHVSLTHNLYIATGI